MKYAHIENNKLMGFYDSEIHSDIPEGSVELTDHQWNQALAAGANSYVDGELVFVEPEDTRTYAEKRASEYPSVTDYLDGVVKGDDAQIQEYISKCLAIKVKYPKGE